MPNSEYMLQTAKDGKAKCECGNEEFYRGPQGGLAYNIICSKCGTEYNNCLPYAITCDPITLKYLWRKYNIDVTTLHEKNPELYKIAFENSISIDGPIMTKLFLMKAKVIRRKEIKRAKKLGYYKERI